MDGGGLILSEWVSPARQYHYVLLRIDNVHGIGERNVGRETIASENVFSYNVHSEQ